MARRYQKKASKDSEPVLRSLSIAASEDLKKSFAVFYTTNVPKIRAGQLSVREFCHQLGILSEGIQPYFTTESYDAYREFVRQIYPQLPEESFEHELAHAEVARRYGLRPEFQLFLIEATRRLFGQVMFNPQLCIEDNLQNAAVDWTPKKLLAYITEVSAAPGEDAMSPEDHAMFDA